MSGVFQNIDPPPPHRPASVYPPHQRRGEDTLGRGRRGGGVNILEDDRHYSVLYIRKYFVILPLFPSRHHTPIPALHKTCKCTQSQRHIHKMYSIPTVWWTVYKGAHIYCTFKKLQRHTYMQTGLLWLVITIWRGCWYDVSCTIAKGLFFPIIIVITSTKENFFSKNCNINASLFRQKKLKTLPKTLHWSWESDHIARFVFLVHIRIGYL